MSSLLLGSIPSPSIPFVTTNNLINPIWLAFLSNFIGSSINSNGRSITINEDISFLGTTQFNVSNSGIVNVTFSPGTYTVANTTGSNATGTWPISISGLATNVTTNANLTGI